MQTLHAAWIWTSRGLLRDACLLLDDGRIVGIERGDRYRDVGNRPTWFLGNHVILPGLVNAHSHAFQRVFRGHVQWRAEREDDFWSWRRAMYAAIGRLTPEGIEAVSRLAFLEMIEAGVTHVGEFHYVHHPIGGGRYAMPEELALRVIGAARGLGMRVTLLRVAYARNAPGAPLEEEQLRFLDAGPEEALEVLDRMRQLRDPLLNVGLAPHSVRAVPRTWLEAFSEWDGVVHAHVAEQPREIELCRAEHGMEPLELFGTVGLLDERFTAVHLTHPGPGDLSRLIRTGARVCACPTTELDLGDGFLPLELREVPLCVGTDSQARVDLLEEVRSLELHGRGLAGRRNVMSPPGIRHGLAEQLLGVATVEGSRSLGVDGGRVEVGASADLIAIDLDRPGAIGVPPLEAAVFSATPEWITDVWVAGHHVVRRGTHVLREEVMRDALPFLDLGD